MILSLQLNITLLYHMQLIYLDFFINHEDFKSEFNLIDNIKQIYSFLI